MISVSSYVLIFGTFIDDKPKVFFIIICLCVDVKINKITVKISSVQFSLLVLHQP